MKACHENKAKTLHLGVRKIILATYAFWLENFFKSLSLKSQKHVHGQATSCRPTVWFVPSDNAIVFTSCGQLPWGA